MSFLAGYRVLDLTDERGLIAGRMLADLGADVVLVEPPAGSSARRVAPRAKDDPASGSFFFDAYAANKRGLVADLDTESGRALVRELAATADFLLESFDPGYLAARGLDWSDLQALNPALIHVSITAFGRSGPKAHWPNSDLTVWAAGGPLNPHRDGDRAPLRVSLPQAFLHAGADAAGGALLAHHARSRTGRGQHVDVSAQASLGIATLARVLDTVVNPDVPDRLAARVPAPAADVADVVRDQKKWRCADGYVEFAIGIGPAIGAFTGAFMRWLVDEGVLDPAVAEIDWPTVQNQLKAGTYSAEELEKIAVAVRDFLLTKSQREILQAATDRKLLCVPIFTTADVAASAQLAARGFWVTVGRNDRERRLPGRFAQIDTGAEGVDAFDISRPAPLIGEHTDEVRAEWTARPARPTGAEPIERPLDGLRVLDLSWVVAGPVIGRALADFGASVTRVESATRVETARHMPPFYGGAPGSERSALYATWNCGKLGVSIDLRTEAGRDLVRALAADSDVVIESFAPGQLDRWGLGYTELARGRDDLIMLSTSIMGQTGPFSKLAGYGNVGAALSGFQDIVGWPDRPALGPFGPYTDYVGPRFSLVALLAALDVRRRTGRGCYIDVAQVEAGVYFQAPELADYAHSGTVVRRRGNADRDHVPHGVYAGPDDDGTPRWVAIAATTDEQWHELARAIGRGDLAGSPALVTAAGRREHEAELDDAVAAWTASRPVESAAAQLVAAGVPAHVSAASSDFCSDPQLEHRGYLIRLPHAEFGSVIVEGPRYLLSDTPGRVDRAAPMFGEDNDAVLIGRLGLSAEQVAQLSADGVLR